MRDLVPAFYLAILCEYCDTIQSVFITACCASTVQDSKLEQDKDDCTVMCGENPCLSGLVFAGC